MCLCVCVSLCVCVCLCVCVFNAVLLSQLQEVLLDFIPSPQMELLLVMLVVPFIVNVRVTPPRCAYTPRSHAALTHCSHTLCSHTVLTHCAHTLLSHTALTHCSLAVLHLTILVIEQML